MASPELKRQKCDVYSRVVGFLTPVQQWNDGKREEYFNRTVYKVDGDCAGDQ